MLGHVLWGFEGMYNYSGNEEIIRVTLLKYIYSFHMPIFFALSGYFFAFDRRRKFEDVKKFVFHKFISLMIPYFLFSIIYWVTKKLLSSVLMSPVSVSELLGIVIRPIEFMWYLYALFFVNCFAEILAYIIKNKKIIWAISLLLMFMPDVGISVIDFVKGYMFYFCLGNIITVVNKRGHKVFLCSLFGIFNIILFFANIDFAMKYVVVTISGVLFWMMLFLCWDEQIKIPILYQLGKNGMPIYLMHVVAVGGIRIILNKIGIVSFVPNLIIGFIGAILLCQVIYELIIRKIKVLDFIFYPARYLNSKEYI